MPKIKGTGQSKIKNYDFHLSLGNFINNSIVPTQESSFPLAKRTLLASVETNFHKFSSRVKSAEIKLQLAPVSNKKLSILPRTRPPIPINVFSEGNAPNSCRPISFLAASTKKNQLYRRYTTNYQQVYHQATQLYHYHQPLPRYWHQTKFYHHVNHHRST